MLREGCSGGAQGWVLPCFRTYVYKNCGELWRHSDTGAGGGTPGPSRQRHDSEVGHWGTATGSASH